MSVPNVPVGRYLSAGGRHATFGISDFIYRLNEQQIIAKGTTVTSPNLYSLTEAASMLQAGTISASELMKSCLHRINLRDSVVQAWVSIDHDAALENAEEADRAKSRSGEMVGPLSGIPIGIKDIIDVAGMPTAGGTQAYSRRIASADAACVAKLKAAGAIIMGKTVTTAFAMGDAGVTTNPWNSAYSPGGSSSGSAAAVADRMCMAAIGTQTGGSVIRPSAFNGLAGFKPAHARIDISGVIPLAWQLDHVGVLTRSVADAHLLWHILRNSGNQHPVKGNGATLQPSKPQRLWRAREMFETEASSAMNNALDAHCQQLRQQGVEIIERPLPGFEAILDNHRIIMATEAAASHTGNYKLRGSLYPPKIKELIEEGLKNTAVDYALAQQHRKNAIAEMNHQLSDVSGLLSPATVDAAPLGLESTGDHMFNVPSSYLGLPVVTYPLTLNNNGLPLGAQIMGCSGSEKGLFESAGWCEQLSGFNQLPADF